MSAWRDVLRHLFPDKAGRIIAQASAEAAQQRRDATQLAAEDRAKALMGDREEWRAFAAAHELFVGDDCGCRYFDERGDRMFFQPCPQHAEADQ